MADHHLGPSAEPVPVPKLEDSGLPTQSWEMTMDLESSKLAPKPSNASLLRDTWPATPTSAYNCFCAC